MHKSGIVAAVLILVSVTAAKAAGVSVTERVRTYRVYGNTIQAVVRSMKQNGPRSELHGRRALGMADYRYRTQVLTKRIDGRCSVTGASVALRIFYTLPSLSKRARLSARDQNRWRSISSMIARHERRHGRYYRQFARELQRALSKMRPQEDCHQIRVVERQLKARFEESNAQRNRRYDRAQYKPFNRRLKRLAPKNRRR